MRSRRNVRRACRDVEAGEVKPAAVGHDSVRLHGALRCPALPHRVPERDRTPVSHRFGQDQEDLHAAIVHAVIRSIAALAVSSLAAVQPTSAEDGIDPPRGCRGQHAAHLGQRALHRQLEALGYDVIIDLREEAA
jgi:hypothetical protein